MQQGRAALVAALAAVVVVLVTATMVLGVAVVAALGGALAGGCAADGGPGGGTQQIGPRTWSTEQTDNAHTIVTHAAGAGLPKRAAVIALSAAIVESQLKNLTYGDRDSLGLFQQRPSQGWGSPEQLLNPAYAAAAFYRQLVAVPGWATLPPGVAAQRVQRSAFPDRYGPQENPAGDLVARLWVGPDNLYPAPSASAASTPVQPAASSTALCPDPGGPNLPPGTGGLHPKQLPPDFTLPTDPVQRAAVAFAIAQVGKPYRWGAKGPDSFDCSGLTTAAWAAAGIAIPAGTVTQKLAGNPVSLTQIAPGDLVFIPGSLGTPTNPRHVGFYAGHGTIINAHDTTTGVILQPLAHWTGHITAIRHIAGPTEPESATHGRADDPG